MRNRELGLKSGVALTAKEIIMLSLDTICEFSVYAIKQDQPNSESMIFPPTGLQDLFQQSLGNLNFPDEQIRQRVQDILQDLKERHVGYRLPPHEPIMEKVLDEVNFQLESSMYMFTPWFQYKV